jgi:hypothetical protein
VRRVRVTWSRTEHFDGIMEIEDHQARDPESAFDGDSEQLVDLEEPNAVDVTGTMTYGHTEREVESVELVDEDDQEPTDGDDR